MLQVYFGDIPETIVPPENVIFNTSVYFKNTYLDSWFNDPFAVKMIKSIDGATVLDSGLIDSPALGKIPPTSLSGGLKTLLLVYFDHAKVFNASTCGDNCAWWLLRIAALRAKEPNGGDVTVNLRHLMKFGEGKFSIRVLNSGNVIHDMDGFLLEAIDWLHGDAR